MAFATNTIKLLASLAIMDVVTISQTLVRYGV